MGITKPLALFHQGAPPPRPRAVKRAYVMSKKEATTSGMVVTRTLFLNSKPFSIPFDLSATHSSLTS